LDNSFIATARISKQAIGSSVLHAKGWIAVELSIRGKCRLAFNVRDDIVITHRFEPGTWESWFGFDHCSDSISLNPELFDDKKDPRWNRFMASALSEWSPRLDPAAADPTAPVT